MPPNKSVGVPIVARDEKVHWLPVPTACWPCSPIKNPTLLRCLAVARTENRKVAVNVSPSSQASGPLTRTGLPVRSRAVQMRPRLPKSGKQDAPLIGTPWALAWPDAKATNGSKSPLAVNTAPRRAENLFEADITATPTVRPLTLLSSLFSHTALAFCWQEGPDAIHAPPCKAGLEKISQIVLASRGIQASETKPLRHRGADGDLHRSNLSNLQGSSLIQS